MKIAFYNGSIHLSAKRRISIGVHLFLNELRKLNYVRPFGISLFIGLIV